MRLIISLAFTVALVLLVRYLSDVLLPFFVACFIAYLLQPVVGFNQRLLHTTGRVLPSIMTVIDVTVIIGLVVYLFLPSVIGELDMLGDILKSISSGKRELPAFYVTVVDFIERYFNPGNIKELLNGSRLETLLSKGSSLLEESFGVLLTVLSWLLTLIYILFIMID